jgi:DNA invertase Pin-like site-specific DNA recombinase
MNAVIYCRVSSKEQVEGTSLESQEIACRDYAHRNNSNVMQVFVDRGESAKFADRPQLLEMIAFCGNRQNAIEELLVWKVDRLARNVGDHFNIKAGLLKHGVRVVSVTEPIDAKPEGKLLETILAGFAQFDNDVRAARTVQGMRRKIQEGIFPWQPPLGYRGASQPGNKKMEPDQPDQPAFGILQRGWHEFATGRYTKAQMLRLLTSCGLRTRAGKPLSNQAIDHLFQDSFYAGLIRDPWSGEELPGRHLPMVNLESFEAVQQVIAARNRALPHVAVRPEFPLRSFVRCVNCEFALTGSFSRGRSKLYPYYHCVSRSCEAHGYYPLAEVHDEFAGFLAQSSANEHSLAHLREFVREIGVVWGNHADLLSTKRELAERRAQEQFQELIRMKMDRLISDDEFRAQRTGLAEHRAGLGVPGTHKPFSVDAALRDLELIGDRLINLVDTWKDVSTDFQRRFQQIVIPGGYVVGSVGTAQKGCLLSFIESPLPVDTNEVPPAWESWNQLIEEINGFVEIFREPCKN